MAPPFGGSLMHVVGYGAQDVFLTAHVGGQPYVSPPEKGCSVVDVRNSLGLSNYAHGINGYLSDKSEICRAREYSRFGKWETANVEEGVFVKIWLKRETRMIHMTDKYKYHQIRRHTGELCAAVLAERFHPRHAEKWEGWGF